ncbi:hypothetical protein ACSBR2_015513 [Camellia fascicularis]
MSQPTSHPLATTHLRAPSSGLLDADHPCLSDSLTRYVDWRLSHDSLSSSRGRGPGTLASSLRGKTITEEDKLTTRLASLQEDITDKPLAVMEVSQIGELNRDTDKALDEHGLFMATMLVEADQLRMSTLKELVGIFTPIQAVDFLAVTKKLHLCMHELGTKRDDHMPGRDKE